MFLAYQNKKKSTHCDNFKVFTLASCQLCIDFKIILLVYKALHGRAPGYLSEMLLIYEPERSLRSSGALLLTVPKSRTETFGDAAFSCYAPKCWNRLPEDVRRAENIDIFKRRLKTLCSAWLSCSVL
ncbi:hypothetical protein LDENG_00015860 [Lucifuga dentata]|nr:hypothetical protein LDENG_00015860 [Lucifuga dentata]